MNFVFLRNHSFQRLNDDWQKTTIYENVRILGTGPVSVASGPGLKAPAATAMFLIVNPHPW